jgi:hypothetical protein
LTFSCGRRKIDSILKGGSMSDEHEHRTEEEVLEEQKADAVEDLDVPEQQADDVAGGAVDMFLKVDPGR